MTKFKTSDLLDAAALEIVAGGMMKDPTKPIISPTTGPTFPTADWLFKDIFAKPTIG
jgi:hypothetical protein